MEAIRKFFYRLSAIELGLLVMIVFGILVISMIVFQVQRREANQIDFNITATPQFSTTINPNITIVPVRPGN